MSAKKAPTSAVWADTLTAEELGFGEKPFYRNFLLTLLLIAFSSFFVSGFKLFFWTIYADGGRFSLETISACLALGGAAGFFVGPVIIDRFGVRVSAVLSALCGIVGLAGSVFGAGNSYAFFLFSALVVGACGSLSLVTKNVLLPLAIWETRYSDTAVSGAANIAFTVFTIAGTVAGSYLAERFGVPGWYGLFATVAVVVPLAFWFRRRRPESVHPHTQNYMHRVMSILRTYFPYIFAISLLWAVITAQAQIFVEIGVERFGQSSTQASVLLLWATLWGVAGSIVSIPWEKIRWKMYRISLALFAFSVFACIPLVDYLAALGLPVALSVLAATVGFFFGAAVNLVEGYYFLKLEFSPLKSYGAAVYGLVASVAIFVVMQILLALKSVVPSASFLVSGAIIVGILLLTYGGGFGEEK